MRSTRIPATLLLLSSAVSAAAAAESAADTPPPDPVVAWMLAAGWTGFLGGVVSGAVIGLCFHREDWMGGYGSHRRRLTRLGHISFFGLGFVNFAFALTQFAAPLPETPARVAAGALLVGAVTMPLCCFLCAWRKPFRHGFFVPVGGVLTGVLVTLWWLLLA